MLLRKTTEFKTLERLMLGTDLGNISLGLQMIKNDVDLIQEEDIRVLLISSYNTLKSRNPPGYPMEWATVKGELFEYVYLLYMSGVVSKHEFARINHGR